MKNLYYEPAIQEEFEELKKAAIEVWQSYDDTYGYASEKMDRIKEILNVADNFMYIFAMFDSQNQRKVLGKLSGGTKQAIKERLLAGGMSELEIKQLYSYEL